MKKIKNLRETLFSGPIFILDFKIKNNVKLIMITKINHRYLSALIACYKAKLTRFFVQIKTIQLNKYKIG